MRSIFTTNKKTRVNQSWKCWYFIKVKKKIVPINLRAASIVKVYSKGKILYMPRKWTQPKVSTVLSKLAQVEVL